MRRFLIFAILILFGSSISFAQQFHYGIVAGANLNKMAIEDPGYHLNQDTEKNSFALSFRVGGFAEYVFNKHVGVQAELFYSQGGYRLTNENSFPEYSIAQKLEIKTNDISFSLFFKYYFLHQRLAIDLGVQPSFCTNIKRLEEESITVADQNLNRDTTFNLKANADYTPFTVAAIGGMTFYINDNLFFAARYTYGFTNLFRKEVGYFDENDRPYTEIISVESKHRVIQLSLGWRF